VFYKIFLVLFLIAGRWLGFTQRSLGLLKKSKKDIKDYSKTKKNRPFKQVKIALTERLTYGYLSIWYYLFFPAYMLFFF